MTENKKAPPRPRQLRKRPELPFRLAAGRRKAIESLPPADQPTERLLQLGPAALTETELLAVLLRDAGEADPLEKAVHWQRLYDVPRGLLSSWPSNEIIRELGDEAAASVLAAAVLSRRLGYRKAGDGFLGRPVNGSYAAKLIYEEFGQGEQVVCGAMLIDSAGKRVGLVEISRGTSPPSSVEPLPILKEALIRGAEAILLFCTRPGPKLAHFSADLLLATTMTAACSKLGFELIDYLIVGKDHWVSLRDHR